MCTEAKGYGVGFNACSFLCFCQQTILLLSLVTAVLCMRRSTVTTERIGHHEMLSLWWSKNDVLVVLWWHLFSAVPATHGYLPIACFPSERCHGIVGGVRSKESVGSCSWSCNGFVAVRSGRIERLRAADSITL